MERHADILIIGSGIAGIRAAVESTLWGKKIIVISNSNVGNSTKSPANIRYNQDFELIMHTGDQMSHQELVRTICELSVSESNSIIKNTDTIPTEFGYMPSSKNGKQVVDYLRNQIDWSRADEMLGYKLVDLMVEKNVCYGAVFIKGFEVVKIYAGSTVLATGGYSNSVGISDNPPTVDGVGISSAFRNGAVLINPEFIMTHPFGIRDRKSILAGEVLEYPEITDEFGNSFLSKEITENIKKNTYHDNISEINRKFVEKITSGGRIFLDYSNVNSDKIKKLINTSVYGKLLNFMDKKRIAIEPIYHYSIGGLSIDKNASTTIERLYASGEVIGGIHGSSRLGGNAIVEDLVFGKIAGDSASKYDSSAKTIECTITQTPTPKTNISILKDHIWLYNAIKAERDIFVKSILVSSIKRMESVGYFLRSDFPLKNENSKNHLCDPKCSSPLLCSDNRLI